MKIIERLPWYENYMQLIVERKNKVQEINEMENPGKQFQRIKKFYENLGAEYTKNSWLIQEEAEISKKNEDERIKLRQLKEEVMFVNILENVICQRDDESINALRKYEKHELYNRLTEKVMFYLRVSKAKTEPDSIKDAYDAIKKNYPLENVRLFLFEGAYYYYYYFQCLQWLIKKYKGSESDEYIKIQIQKYCSNTKLMLNRYSTVTELAKPVNWLLGKIIFVESLLIENDIK